MINELNDTLLLQLINTLDNTFGNGNYIIGGSIGLYLDDINVITENNMHELIEPINGKEIHRRIRNFDITLSNNESEFTNEELNAYKNIFRSNCNTNLELNISKYNVDSVKEENYNIKEFNGINVKVYTLEYILNKKTEISNSIVYLRDKYDSVIQCIQNAIDNNKFNYTPSDDEIEELYKYCKAVIEEFNDKTVIFEGDCVLGLLGVEIPEYKLKNIEIYFLGETYKMEKLNPYRNNYYYFFKDKFDSKVTLTIFLKRQLPEYDNDYTQINLKDITINVASLNHILKYYEYNYRIFWIKDIENNIDIELIRKKIKELTPEEPEENNRHRRHNRNNIN